MSLMAHVRSGVYVQCFVLAYLYAYMYMQDYRQILEDYKLFHIVVMKQDVRPVLVSWLYWLAQIYNIRNVLFHDYVIKY